jgi:Eukaryotic cytochrome b561
VGTYIHAALVNLALLCFLAAFIIIEVNKSINHPVHLKSPHAIMGLITFILLLLQVFVGAAQFFFPTLAFGSVDRGKAVYKYHRMSGYLIVVLLCATVSAATWTDHNLDVMQIHHWSVITASVILLAGLFARIKKSKLAFGNS